MQSSERKAAQSSGAEAGVYPDAVNAKADWQQIDIGQAAKRRADVVGNGQSPAPRE